MDWEYIEEGMNELAVFFYGSIEAVPADKKDELEKIVSRIYYHGYSEGQSD
jgi:hypothetical protein